MIVLDAAVLCAALASLDFAAELARGALGTHSPICIKVIPLYLLVSRFGKTRRARALRKAAQVGCLLGWC